MGLRPAKCYKKFERSYTRKSQSKPKKSYIKGVPESKIHKFEMGNLKKQFSLTLGLKTNDSVQIRHNALEAVRITIHDTLEKEVGTGNYFFKILVYPHQVLRENPLATGAGADRYQTGMRLAFGNPIGTAARVKAGQALLIIKVDKDKENIARKVLKIATSKLPTTCQIFKA